MMVGPQYTGEIPQSQGDNAVVRNCGVESLSRGGYLQDSISVYMKAKCWGIAGLVGAGRTETAEGHRWSRCQRPGQ